MNNAMETPQIQSYTNNSSSYDGTGMIRQLTTDRVWADNRTPSVTSSDFLSSLNRHEPVKLKRKPKMPSKRIVQIFIADPDKKMPLKQSLIYEGKSFLTDSDDEELFFDLPIKELLAKHNERREKVLDKKTKTERYLEPIRIRELKMTVVTLAEF